MNKKYFSNIDLKMDLRSALIVPVLLALVVAFPETSFAEPDGSIDDPYIITTCQDLQGISDNVPNDTYFKLDGPGGVIDCSVTNPDSDDWDDGTWGDEAGFNPISNFAGVLDGNNNTITGLFINRDSDQVGLFATTQEGADIHDLNLTNEYINAGSDTGGLIGLTLGTLNLSNITTSGSVSGYNGVGGIVGDIYIDSVENYKMSVTLSELHSTSSVHAGDYVAGGLLGYIDLEAHNNAIDVSLTDSSHTSGSVEAISEAGGLVGETYLLNNGTQLSTNIFSGLSASGDVTSNTLSTSGGVFGHFSAESGNAGKLDTSVSDINYNTGTVYAEQDGAGGIFGTLSITNSGTQNTTANFTDLHAKGDVSVADGYSNAGGVVGYLEFDANEVGRITGSFTDSSASGGTITADYEAGGVIGELDITNDTSRPIDIVLSGLSSTSNIDGYEYTGGVIGYVYNYADYTGGNTLTFTDSHHQTGTISADADSTGGVVGEYDIENDGSGDLINNISGLYSKSVIEGGEDAYYLGGVIGYLYQYNQNDGELTTSLTDSYHNSGLITGESSMGGVVGYVETYNYSTQQLTNNFSGLHSDSVVASNDNSSDIGGVFGEIYEYTENDGGMTTSLTNSYHNTGDVSGSDEVGGIIGVLNAHNYSSQAMVNTFSGLHSNSQVFSDSGDSDIGGIIGSLSIENINDGSLETSLTDSYHEGGDVHGDSSIGGIIGNSEIDNYGTQLALSTFTGLYAKGNVYGDDDCIAGIVGCFYVYNNNDASSHVIFSDSYHSDGNIEGDSYAGGIFGYYEAYSESSTQDMLSELSGLHTNSPVSVDTNYAGAIAGMLYVYNDGDGATIHTTVTDSYHDTGEIYAGEGDVGGLFGSVWVENFGSYETSTEFSRTYNTSDVTSDGTHGFVGGLFSYLWNVVGEEGNTPIIVSNSYYDDGTVTGVGYVGGITSWMNMAEILNSYAGGNVVSTSALVEDEETDGPGGVGGLVGEAYPGTSRIFNSFSGAHVTTTDPDTENIAGLIGFYTDELTLDNNFYDKARSGQINCALDNDQIANNAPGVCQESTGSNYFYANHKNAPLDQWDFDETWFSQSSDYPKFTKEKRRSSGGGGGGGGGTTASVAATNLNANAVVPETPSVAPTDCLPGFSFSPSTGVACLTSTLPPFTPTSEPAFSPALPSATFATRTLKFKMTGSDVNALQVYLNTHGFELATSGGGSLGHESNYFGGLTLATVKKFQAAKGLVADGVVGPMTFALMK